MGADVRHSTRRRVRMGSVRARERHRSCGKHEAVLVHAVRLVLAIGRSLGHLDLFVKEFYSSVRSEVNIELNFPPKLRGARSRLYRRRFLQVNTRWKALAEIYTMHSFAPFSNLNFFVKNRQNKIAIELMNIH